LRTQTKSWRIDPADPAGNGRLSRSVSSPRAENDMLKRRYRILVASEPFFGSMARGVVAGLRRLGNEVESANYREIIPKVTTARLKLLRRFLLGWFVRDYNNYLLGIQERFEPEMFLAVKGSYILDKTIREFRRRGVRTYNFYPDVSAFTHDKYIPKALAEYDHIFSTKSFHKRDFPERLGVRSVSFVPHGYDPDVYRPLELSEWDIRRYECDVCFIGSHTAKKERLIASIAAALPDVRVKIWGNLWKSRCKSAALDGAITGRPLLGWDYAKAVRASRISLGINSEVVMGASSGDLMSQRSFEIPASGGFMIHERNDEIRSFYREDKEVVLFDDSPELVEKVRYYLDRPDEREAIARAGHERCVPAYSYDERMKQCLHFHEQAVTLG